MTDLETFRDMLTRAGIEYRMQDNGNFYADGGQVTAVELSANSESVFGYYGFTTHFTFDRDTDALSSVYIWE